MHTLMTSFGIGRYLYSNSIWVEIPVTGTKADYDTKEYVFNWLIYLALMSIVTEFVGLFIAAVVQIMRYTCQQTGAKSTPTTLLRNLWLASVF